MIKLRNISKNFGGIKALQNVSLDIQPKKITALIGPNGSGKSTLFNIIAQTIDESQGSIHLEKENITNLKDFQVSKEGISRTFQDVRLYKYLTIKDHFDIALNTDDESLTKSLFKKPVDYTKTIETAIELVGLKKPLNTLGHDLSYGQKKLLDLALAIAKPHKVLLLDEPVAGVNPALRKKIKSIIKRLNLEGETIVIIEHDMNFIMDLADEVFVLDEGKLIAQGKPKDIQKNKTVLMSYLGE